MPQKSYYVASDAMGNAAAILDEEGNILERRSYEAFGEMNCMTPDGTPIASIATQVDVGFQGQIREKITGLYQMGFRWYNPSLGRWLSQDPIGLSGGTNLACYSNNAAPNTSDPLGLDAIPLTAPAPSETTIIAEESQPKMSSLQAPSALAVIATAVRGAEWAREREASLKQRAEDCKKIHKDMKAEGVCFGCTPSTPKEEACRNMACWKKQLIARKRFLELSCDEFLEGSIKDGVEASRQGHVKQVMQVTKAFGSCKVACCK
jgi:RHS repeat-associated protein